MRVTVVKFGGSSLSSAGKIKQAARLIVRRMEDGFRVVAVVSAQGKMTDRLLQEAQEITPSPNPREVDMLLTTGERISAALVSLAVNATGGRAVSLTGSQAGIITDDRHTNARIIDVRPARVLRALENGKAVVVGGFQGVSFRKEITTLGRGGSDVSAAALAAALGAERCEIYSDVDGVYSADPRVVDNPIKRLSLSYDEMIELARAGAGVLHHAAVEFARDAGVPVLARATASPEDPGTIICNLDDRLVPRVAAVTSEGPLACIRQSLDNHGADASSLLSRLDELNINFDEWVLRSAGHRPEIHVFLAASENYHWDSLPAQIAAELPKAKLQLDLARVSAIGTGIGSEWVIRNRFLEPLEGTKVHWLRVTPTKLSAVVDAKGSPSLTRDLHDALIEKDARTTQT